MREVSQKYIEKVTAKGRVFHTKFLISKLVEGENGTSYSEPSTVGNSGLLKMKIVSGQTTGGFTLGNTVCASFELTFVKNVNVQINDKIQVQICFGDGESATEWLNIGYFYVDSINQQQDNKVVKAYDKMLQFSRVYESQLTYPVTVSGILQEISEQTGIPLSKSINLINDVEITKKPQGFLIRDMLGYLAGINGGSVYIDPNEEIAISTPTETGYTINAAQAVSQTLQDTDFTVENFVLNTSNRTVSVGDHFSANTVEIDNPLSISSVDGVIANLKESMSGLSYDSVTVKKQGTGMFQLGDLLGYAALDNKVYRMLIMGVVYDFTDGFFFETLYSMAQSASQQKNQGNRNTNQSYSISTSDSGGGSGTPGDLAYTTGIHFKPGGFDLDFVTTGGEKATNSFAVSVSEGRVTKITNQTAGREIEVTYK